VVALEENRPVDESQLTLMKLSVTGLIGVIGGYSGGSKEDIMIKNCNKCKKEFEAKEELDMFCSDDCKQEALADLDKDSHECLSCHK
jgi:hypothetical protein